MYDHDIPRQRTSDDLAPPNGCRWCGVDSHDHWQRWHPEGGRHGWTQPTDEQRLSRMRARRAERLRIDAS